MGLVISLDRFAAGTPLLITLSAEDASRYVAGEQVDLRPYIEAAQKAYTGQVLQTIDTNQEPIDKGQTPYQQAGEGMI